MKINFDKKISTQTITWTFGSVFVAVLLSFCLFCPALTFRSPQENTNTPTPSNDSSQIGEQVKKNCIDCKCNIDDWSMDCCDNCEKTFDKPIDVVWTGEVATFMMSGEMFAIKKTPEDKKYPLFEACCLPSGDGNSELHGMVKVTGKWTGITCDYVNTIFGQCVPYVEIKKIEKMEQQYTPIISLNDIKWWTAEINEDNKYASVNMEYPQFIGGDEVKKINEYIRGTVLNVLSFERDQVKTDIENKEKWCEEYPGDAYGERVWTCSVQLISKYSVVSIVNNIVSLEIVITNFTGGGNGNHELSYVINWDLQNNLPLEAKDMFCDKKYPDNFALLAASGILSHENKVIPYSGDGLDGMKDSIEEKFLKNEFEILLGYHGIFVVFQPYAIGSGADGIIKAHIPYSDLEGKICLK